MAFIIFKDGEIYKTIESRYAELVIGSLPYSACDSERGDYTWAVQSFGTENPSFPDMVEPLHEWLWRVGISYETIFDEYFIEKPGWEFDIKLVLDKPNMTEQMWRNQYEDLYEEWIEELHE